jgi:hypothetical protein
LKLRPQLAPKRRWEISAAHTTKACPPCACYPSTSNTVDTSAGASPLFSVSGCAGGLIFGTGRTPVTGLPNSPRYRFSLEAGTRWGMRCLLSETHSGRQVSLRLFGAGICLLALAPLLLADTPTLLRRTPTAGCYCHCAGSKLQGGCVKMCESKKYASRWWAKSCAKPHMSTPRHDSHAGPRFPHPRRSEHAQL